MHLVSPCWAIKSNSWLSDLKLPGLADVVEIDANEDPARLLDIKLLTDFDLTSILSSPFPSCVLFDIAWVQLGELKRLMLKRHRRWFHSSRVKFPVVKMSASWFLERTHSIWILEFKLILSNNQSRATLWNLETCLIGGLMSLMIILITASLTSKMYNIAPLWKKLAFDEAKSTLDISRFPLETDVLNWECNRFSDGLSCNGFLRVSSLFCFRFDFWWSTSITTCQRSSAGTPSIRNPGSREIISDSVEQCDTHICFLHIQLIGINVWLPNITTLHLRSIFNLQDFL